MKGFGPEFVAHYDLGSKSVFSVGELWTNMTYEGSTPSINQDSHRQKLCDWLDKVGPTAALFDFTTKGILQEGVISPSNWYSWR